ncbi:MAG: autotransporter-associated beta strand repeat-containing protein [Flammeovirgaceae bacterium]|nr:MAG: autotransporter-associated beta strand repeat-containing protein [Flammeovirgaceae bacterium]
MLRFLRPFHSLLTVKSGKRPKIGLLSAVFIILVFTLSFGVNAQTWVPAGGGDWNTAANWSPAVVPGAGANVVIPASHTGGTITGIPTISLNSLTVSGSGNCVFSASVSGNLITVTGSFSVASGKTFTIGAPGARMEFTLASTATGVMNGNVVLDAFTGGADRFFTNNGDLTISPGATLSGVGESNFLTSAGSTLRIGSPQGITLTTMTGSVQMTGSVPNRVYSTGANYVYIGNANQAVGDGLPATVANLTITNSGGGGNNTVTLASSIAISNGLFVSNGVFALGANNVTTVSSVEMTGTTITGTGTITLAGDVITNASATTALISAPVALGGSIREFKVADGPANPDLSISSVISGTGGVRKGGSGILFLSAANTFTGGTFIESGTLRLGNTNALNSGAVTFSPASTGILQLNGNSISVSSLNTDVVVGTPVIENGGGAAATLTVNSTGSSVFAGTIQNGGAQALALTKSNSGSLTLSGTNTYSGGTSLTGGTLNINSASAIGTGSFVINAGTTIDNTSSGAITLTTNNAQNWNGDFIYTGTQNLNVGTGAVTLSANRQVTTSGGMLTVGGVISGGFRLTKAGAGTLTLAGANTHSGTTLSAGTLNINSSTALGSTASTFIINGGTIDNTTSGAITTGNYPQSWAGDFTFAGTQNLNLGTGAVTLTANRQVTTNAGNLTVGGIISGAFALTKGGAGTLTLTGANAFSGGTTLNAGTLNINNASALGTAAGTFTINGGTINNTSGSGITTLNYPQSWNADFTFTGTQNLNLGTGTVTLSANRLVTVSANTLAVGGIMNAPAFNLTKAGGGTLALGSNPVTLNSLAINAGTFTSTSGTLTIGGSLTNSGTFNNNNGTVLYNGASPQTVAGVTYFNLSFSGAGQKNAVGTVNVTNNLVNASVFDVAGFTLSVGGTINNTVGTIRFSGVSNGLAISTGTIEYYGSGQLVAAGTYENLTINQSSGEAQLAGDVTVNGVLTISNGNLNLAGFNLTLGPSASISIVGPSSSRMIIATGGSEVKKIFSTTGSFAFPIGDNTGALDYSPVTVNVTAGSGFPAEVGVSVQDIKHPSNASTTHFLTRYWNITTTISGAVATVTATYPSVDINGTETSIKAARLTGSFNPVTNPWVRFGNLAANTLTASGSIAAGQVSSFTGITGTDPSVIITGGGVTVCAGGSVNLLATPTGDAPFLYDWAPAAGLSATTIANPVASPAVTTLYTVTVTDGNGITANANTTITVEPNPTPSISGVNSVCAGQTGVVYSTTNNAGNTYLWEVSGGTIVGPATNSSVTIDWGVAGSGWVRVTETITATSCSTLTPNYAVTINPNPTPVIGGPATACANQAGLVYSTALVAGNTYAWSVTGGSITAGAGTNSITVTWGAAGTGTVQVTQTVTATGCATTTAPYNVTINPTPTPSVAGVNSVCAGQTGVVYSTTNNAGNTYLWEVSGGTIVGPATNNSVTIDWGVAGPGWVRVTETITATSCATLTPNYTVTINPNPTPVIGGPATACANQAGLVYSTALVAGNTYAWSVTGGSITAGAGTNSITVTWGAAGTGTVQVTQTVTATGCATTTAPYNVTINPTPTPSVAGVNSVCAGQTGVVYSTTNNAGNTYLWEVSGGTIVGPATNNSVTIDWGVAGPGWVRVTETITATSCATLTPNYTVTINPNPTPVIGGPATACANQAGLVYSTALVAGNTYAWSVTGGSITAGAGTNSITVTWGAAGTGTVQVTQTVTATGCATTTAPYNVTINPTPTPSVAGVNSVCAGQTGVVYSTTNNAGNTYLWEVSGGTIVGPATNNSVTIDWGVAGPGWVRVTETITATSCATLTPNYTVTINPNPTPVIGGPATACANQAGLVYSTALVAGNTYAWSVTGGSITAGAGTNSITVTWGAAGTGTVQVTQTVTATGCATTTAPYNVTINPTPTPSVAGVNSVCAGQTGVVYSTTNNAGNTYLWEVSGGTIVGPATNNSVTIDWGVAGPGWVRVTETITATSCATLTPNYTVTINPNPTPVIGGPATACANQAGLVYSTALVAGNTYAWSVTGGSITAGAGTNSITVTWGAAGTGTVQVTQTVTATGCATTTAPYNVTINPTPTPSVAGVNSVCAGQTGVVYSTTNNAGNTYLWEVSGGTIVGPATNNSVTIDWGVAGPGWVRVTETITATSCATLTPNYTVTINPNPTPVIGGPATACANQAGLVYSTALVAGNTYAWSVTGGSITAGAGTNSITVTWGAAGTGTVQVTQTVTATGCATTTAPYNVTINPTPTPSVAGVNSVCAGQTGVVYSTTNNAGNTYLWEVSGGTIVGPATNNSVTIDWGVAGPGWVRVTETITATSCATLTPNYTVTINPNPTPVIGGPATACANQAGLVYSTALVAGNTYAWSVTGGSITAGAGTNSITVTWGAAGTGTVQVTQTVTATGCATTTAPYNVTINPTPTPSVAGVNSVCAGQTGVVYSTTNNAGNTYLWEVSGGTIVGPATNNSVTIDWGVAGPGWVRVTETITATSCATLTPNYTVTINPNPTPVIGGPATACANQAGLVYSTALVAGNTYAWSVTGGSITAGAGTNSITVTWGAAGTGTVQVTQTVTATGCATTTAPYNVTINPTPTPSVAGVNSVCAGQTGVVYSTTNNAGNTYLWEVSGGTIVGPATNNSVTIDWGVAGPGWVRVTETITATSCATLTPNYTVTINPNPTPVIGGPATACANQAGLVYSTALVAGNTYAWSVTGGSITAGAGTNSITVTWGAAGTGTVQVTQTVTATGCATTTAPYNVTINPTPTPSVAGVNSVCAGQTGVVYSTTNNAGNTYLWEVSGGTIVGPATNNSVTIDWGVAGPGWVRVTETITATSCATLTPNYTVTINPNPTPVIGGPATACANQAGLVYSTALVAGNTYAWSVTGGSITAGAGTNSITVTWGAAGTGTVQVTQTVTATGCATTTAPYNVTINPTPTPSVAGVNSVCAGQTGVVYSTTNNAGNTYLWEVSGGTIVGPATNNSVTIDWGVAGPGWVRVTETITATSCATLTPNYTVTINPNPTPVIGGPATACANQAGLVYSTALVAGNTYAWSVTGGSITAGAGTNSITVTWGAAGTGTVQVTQTVTATGCATTTAPYNVTINPTPTPSVAGVNSVCAGQTGVVYSTTNNAGNTYLWEVSGGTIVGPATNNSVTIDWGVAGPGWVRVTETITATSCATLTPNYTVTINPNPTPVIGGPATACANQAGLVYSTALVAGNTYAWSVTGGSITAGAGTNSITVTWGAAGTGTVQVTQTVTATGCATTTAPYNVTINPTPTPSVAGVNSVCAGQTGVVYSTTNNAGNTYLWEVSGGTIVGPATNNSVTIDWGVAGPGWVRVTETITATSCATLTPNYTVTINPNPTPVIGGPATACANQAGLVYSTALVAGNTYAWSVTGGSITAGAGTNSITVTWGAAGTGTVQVTQTVTATGCATTTAPYNVTINPTPTPSVAGVNSVCAGQTGVVYSTTNNAGNTYLWEVSGGTIVGPATNNSVTIDWGVAGPGWVRVTETITATSCATLTPNYTVTINPNPTPVIGGPATACANQAGLVYSTALVAGNTYAWSVTGGSITAGAGTNSITVTWGAAGTGTVQVTQTVTATGCATTTAPYNVTINPTPTPSVAGVNSVCAGQTGVVYSTTNNAGSTYLWEVSGGTIVGPATNNSVTIDWGVAGPGWVRVTETITATSCSTLTPNYAVTINPNPTPVVSGTTTVCANQAGLSYSSPNVPGNIYIWSVLGGTITAGGGTNSITVTWGSAGSGSVTLIEFIPSTGCVTTSAPLAVTINANPTPAISGDNTVCANELGVIYSTPFVAGNTYSWTVTGGVINGSSTGNSIVVDWGGTPGTGTVQLVETVVLTGCSITTPVYNVTINPAPAPVISGSAIVCANQSGEVYSTPNTPGNVYNWTVSGGTIVSGIGTNSIVVDWGGAGAGTITLTEFTPTGCAVSATPMSVTINPTPTPVISGNNTVCANDQDKVYSTPLVAGRSYAWVVTGGTIDGPSTGNSIVVDWGGAGTGTIQLTETIIATGCFTTTPVFSVNINPIPTPIISGAGSVCANETGVVYSTPNVPGNSYTWTVVGGSIISGAGTNSITVNWGGAGTGSVTVTEFIPASSCSVTTPSFTVIINPIPSPVVSGDNTVCEGATAVTYSTPFVAGNTYNWVVTGGTIVGSATNNSVTVDWGAAGSGTLQVTETVGSCSVVTPVYPVTIYPNPSPVISGTNSVCSNQAGVVYSTPNVIGNTYNWEVVGGSITSGTGTNSITVTWAGAGTGSVKVTETIVVTGCAVETSPLLVTISPSPVVDAGSNEEICQGTVFNFSSQSVPASAVDFGSLTWTTTGAGILTNASTLTPTYSPAPAESGVITFTLTATGTGACPDAVDVMQLTITPLPVVSAGSSEEICQGTLFAFNTQSTPASATNYASLNWTHTGTGTLFNATTLTPTYLPNPAEVGPVTFTLEATSPGSCSAVNSAMTLTITPAVAVNAGSNEETCAGVAFNFVSQATPAAASNYSSLLWSSSGTGTLTNATTLTPTYTPGIGEVGNVTFTLTAFGNGSCPDKTSQMTLSITPAPAVSAGSNEEICEGLSFNFSSQATPATAGNFSSISWSTTGSGTIFNGSTLTPLYVPSLGETGTLTFTLTANGNGSCLPVNSTMNLTITPKPVVNAGSDAEVCQTSSIDFSLRTTPASASAFSSLLWTTTGSGTIFNATTLSPTYVPGVGESGTLVFTLTATGNGSCASVLDQMNLVVTPPPVVSAGSNEQICQGSLFDFSTQGTPANASNTASLLWTTTGTGTLFSANTLTPVYQPASGETGTITFTLTGTGLGTCAAVNSAMQLTITPAAVVNAGSDAETCEGIAFDFSTQFIAAFALNYSSLQWTTTGTGTLSGATTLTPVYTAGVGETGLVTFTLTAFGNGVCPDVTDQMVLSITPGILVDAGSNEEICQGSTFSFSSQSVPASALNVASVFWSHTGSGSLFNANTLTPTYFSSPTETGVVTFTLTGFSSGSCSSINDVMQLTITPAPVAIAGNNDAVCEGTPTFDFAARTTPASFANGTVFWTHTGAGSLSSNTIINPVYTVHPSDVNTTITFTLTVTSPSAVCSPVQSQFTLNVNRAAIASVPLPATVCEPQRINLSGTIGGSASSGAWSLITGGGTLSVSSITGLNVTAVYDTVQADVGTSLVFRLTAFDPDGAGPCTNVFADYTVTVEEAPKVFAGADFAICEYEDINLNGSFGGSTTSVTWSGGVPAQFGNINNPVTSYTLNAAERAATNLMMTFTLTTNDPPGVCGPVNDQVVVAVRDTLNSVLFTGVLKSVYAENEPPEDLTFAAVPIGGVFSGPGISGLTFFPSIANITPQPPNVITYTYQDPATGCFSAPKKTVVVNPITVVNFRVQNENPDPLNLGVAFICNNQGELILIEEPLIPDITALTPPESAVFSSTNPIISSRITFDVSGTKKFRLNTDGLPPGVYPITYTFTNSLGASNPVTRPIRVTASPKAVIDAGNSCEDIDAVMLESSFMTTPNTYGATLASWFWEFNDGTGTTNTLQEPVYRFPGDGFYPVRLRVTTSEGCFHDTIKSIRIGPVPKVNFSWSEFCQGDDTQFTDNSDAGISTIIQYEWRFGDGFNVINNYPAQAITDAVPPAQSNAGRTSGTFKNPRHRYDAFGQKNVRLFVLTNDGCLKDTTITVTILDYSAPTPVTSYFEDFELGQGSWFSSKANQTGAASDTSWVFGLPAGNVITSASSGTNAWWTGTNPNFAVNQDKSRYYNNERSAIIGPCLDLRSIKRPMISLDYWADSEARFDGAVLQYSTDGGINWHIIGDDSGPGINWYNGRALTGNPGIQPLGQFGWTDRQGGWKNARHNLDQIPMADRDQVIFRIAFGSNSDNGTPPPVNGVPDLPFDGFAFDNVFIGEKQRNVLVEYFTNSGISLVTNDYLNNLYNNQFTFKDSSDFFKIQYHIGNPDVNDPIYQQNKIDPDARKLYYLIQSPPVGIMDGIVGDYFGTNFNGDQTKITAVEVDRRALEDSVFMISIQQLPTTNDSIKADVTFRYVNTTQPLNTPVRLYIGLVETNLAGNINVLRKMLLGNEGKLVSNTWVYNTTQVESIRSIIDIPIGVNNPNLYLVAWVQDNATKRIHQARIVQSPPKTGSTVVGVEDDPALAAVKDIVIYPNPASKQFNFAIESSFSNKVSTRGYTYSLIDQRGVVVGQGQLNEDLSIPQEVDIGKLANGMYIVIINKHGKAVTQRKLAVMNRH